MELGNLILEFKLLIVRFFLVRIFVCDFKREVLIVWNGFCFMFNMEFLVFNLGFDI